MLDATAHKLVSSQKVHREMRTSLEAVSTLIEPNISAIKLGEALHLHRISKGAELDWSQDHQRQAVLAGTDTRTGDSNSLSSMLKDIPVVSINIQCSLTNTKLARTISLQDGLPSRSSRLVELNFTHNFTEQLRQKFLAQAKPELSVAALNTTFQQNIATAGFEYLAKRPLIEGYRQLGSHTIVKAEPEITLADCLFFSLNLHIGIVGGQYGVHWADSYCINNAGHLSLFGI
ncbi:hypothetical protein [Salinibius halmophilus]|uniref:hypothetical protein n=1 Tax=Salinibius halmophilus TaxID=1853216 RepID=UPI000E676397|nr:hypothetical protein [Salinibius halmophilus]